MTQTIRTETLVFNAYSKGTTVMWRPVSGTVPVDYKRYILQRAVVQGHTAQNMNVFPYRIKFRDGNEFYADPWELTPVASKTTGRGLTTTEFGHALDPARSANWVRRMIREGEVVAQNINGRDTPFYRIDPSELSKFRAVEVTA